MNTERILAHRGLWEKRAEANSREAILQAFNEGFGIETDLRSTDDGKIILCHDAVCPDPDPPTLEWLLEAHSSISPLSILALNIKADGLHTLIKNQLSSLDDNQYFLFDMSVPDLLSGASTGLRQYGRASCYENPDLLASYICGLWVDCFDDTFPNLDNIQALASSWEKLAFVSPELHGRSHQSFWQTLKASGTTVQDKAMLCTDLPRQAFEFFR
jgi:glycerophosphoryl diester phosphodiesterase